MVIGCPILSLPAAVLPSHDRRPATAPRCPAAESGGVRPFGVSLLMAGYDDHGPQLYQIDPSGSYFAWKASGGWLGAGKWDWTSAAAALSAGSTHWASTLHDRPCGG